MSDPPHFAFFMVRVRVDAPDEGPSCTGVVEQVGTGRKRHFPDGPGLLRLLTDWSRDIPNMRGVENSGNQTDQERG